MYFLLYNIKKKGRDQHIEQNISKPNLKIITFQKLGSNLINELDPPSSSASSPPLPSWCTRYLTRLETLPSCFGITHELLRRKIILFSGAGSAVGKQEKPRFGRQVLGCLVPSSLSVSTLRFLFPPKVMRVLIVVVCSAS